VVTNYLLDPSVAVRILLGHSPAAARWFDAVIEDDDSTVVASRLLRTELTRVLRREGIEPTRRDQIIAHVWTVPLSDAVFVGAETIVPHLKTLDALHLASLMNAGRDAVVVTHDATMRSVAGSLGYHTFDPVTD
jgi:predicted nucleic acid-binding protein